MIYNFLESMLSLLYAVSLVIYVTCGTVGIVIFTFISIMLLGAAVFAFCFFASTSIHYLTEKARGKA